MLRAILNKSWRQHPTRHQLYVHLPPITKTIQVRRTRHAGYFWRSKDELIIEVLLWTPVYGQAKAGRTARTYIQQLCEDTGCSPEDQPEAMNDREKLQERVSDICAGGTTWWWWWQVNIFYQFYLIIKHMWTTQRCCVIFWTNPGSRISQNCSFMVTYLLSDIPSKHLGTDGDERTNSWVTFSDGLLDMYSPM